MPEQLEISDSTQPATGTTGDTGQPATGQGDNVQPATAQDQNANQTDQQDQQQQQQATPGPIPYDRFAEVNQRMKAAEDELQTYRNFLLQQQQNQAQAQTQQQPQQASIYRELGFEGEDQWIQAKDFVQVLPRVAQALHQQIMSEVSETIGSQQNPEVGKVVGRKDVLTGQFRFGAPLQEYIQNHPDQAQHVQQLALNPATRQIVFQLVTNDPNYKATSQAQQQLQASQQQQQIINAARGVQPPSVSQFGGGGTLNEAQVRAGWTDQQLREHIERQRMATG